MSGGGAVPLTCDGASECPAPVAMIDDKGFTYCATHGERRKSWRRCRKLRPAELRTIKSGQQLQSYDLPRAVRS